jgi:lysylphosphatidylglycerol synthetase-like protein (DUF2156 family)
MPGDIWSLALIGGPILLLAVIIWAFLRNRSAPRSTTQRAERGAAELRAEIERGDPPPRR